MPETPTHFLTLAAVQEDDLWSMGKVLYERVEVAFNHEMVVFTRMSNEEPPVTFTLTIDEMNEFLAAYTSCVQGDEPSSFPSSLYNISSCSLSFVCAWSGTPSKNLPDQALHSCFQVYRVIVPRRIWTKKKGFHREKSDSWSKERRLLWPSRPAHPGGCRAVLDRLRCSANTNGQACAAMVSDH